MECGGDNPLLKDHCAEVVRPSKYKSGQADPQDGGYVVDGVEVRASTVAALNQLPRKNVMPVVYPAGELQLWHNDVAVFIDFNPQGKTKPVAAINSMLTGEALATWEIDVESVSSCKELFTSGGWRGSTQVVPLDGDLLRGTYPLRGIAMPHSGLGPRLWVTVLHQRLGKTHYIHKMVVLAGSAIDYRNATVPMTCVGVVNGDPGALAPPNKQINFVFGAGLVAASFSQKGGAEFLISFGADNAHSVISRTRLMYKETTEVVKKI